MKGKIDLNYPFNSATQRTIVNVLVCILLFFFLRKGLCTSRHFKGGKQIDYNLLYFGILIFLFWASKIYSDKLDNKGISHRGTKQLQTVSWLYGEGAKELVWGFFYLISMALRKLIQVFPCKEWGTFVFPKAVCSDLC